MSCEPLAFKNIFDDVFDIESLFVVLDSLVSESDDELPLEDGDILAYLSLIAYECEN